MFSSDRSLHMRIKKAPAWFLLIVSLTAWLTAAPFSFAGDKKPDDIVAKYLTALGTPQARAAAKSRMTEGPARFRALVGGALSLDGKGAILSDGQKLQLTMNFPNNDYSGERIVYDGNNLQVDRTTSR